MQISRRAVLVRGADGVPDVLGRRGLREVGGDDGRSAELVSQALEELSAASDEHELGVGLAAQTASGRLADSA